jgi:hypothetical protein
MRRIAWMRLSARRIRITHNAHPLLTDLGGQYCCYTPSRTKTTNDVLNVQSKIFHDVLQVHRDACRITRIVEGVGSCTLARTVFTVRKLVWRKPPVQYGTVADRPVVVDLLLGI